MGRFREAAGCALALLLVACSDGQGSSAGPTAVAHAAIRKLTVIRTGSSPAPTAALFQPQQGILPYPTDSYFAGSTDGTLRIQPASTPVPHQVAVDALDGFSTTAVIRARFSAPLSPGSFTPESVVVLQVAIDNTTKAVTGIIRPLVSGVDYTAGVGTGAGNTLLEIRPTHPLTPSTGLTNNGYLVLLTRGITDSKGTPVAADNAYASIKSALPTCSVITDNLLQGICQSTAAHMQIARSIGLNPADIVLSFSFSIESTADSLTAVARTATPQPLVVRSTGLTTAQANSMLSGHATVYVGTLSVPYYLSRIAPLSGSWQGGPSPLDAGSRTLTRFNPIPAPTETLQIPVLVTVPNANSAGGGVKPPNGKWPVLIFQHGFGRSRVDMLAVADSFADSGFVVVAIDLPLHGITDPGSMLYAAGGNPLYTGLSLPPGSSIERTLDLDVLDNNTGAPGSDGKIDPSGSSFINLTSLLTTRDNLRQGAADLITLVRSLPYMKLDEDSTADVDPANIHFLGHSLGAIVGGVFMGVVSDTEVSSATLAMPGGGLSELLLDSATLGPRLTAGLQAQGLVAHTRPFEQFLQDAQATWDAGDPVNYIAAAAAHHPIHLLQVIGSPTSPADQVVPNSATQRLIDAAALGRIPAPVSAGRVPNARGSNGYVNFIIGDHESLVDPTASLATTIEMQAEAISFTGAPVPPIPQLSFPGLSATRPGSTLLVLNPPVIEP
jgi:pimeloyl-ACP methyl ester carboxylesterase